MIWGWVSAASVHQICFLKRLINAAVYYDILYHFFIPYKFGTMSSSSSITWL